MMSHKPIVALPRCKSLSAVVTIRVSFGDLGTTQAHQSFLVTAFRQKRFTIRFAHYAELKDRTGRTLDSGLAILFASPHSFTGENLFEFQCHGSIALSRLVANQLLRSGSAIGLGLAEAGEFTRRAYSRGKLSLVQALAVANIARSPSTKVVQAAAHFGGSQVTTQLAKLHNHLTGFLGCVAANVYFTRLNTKTTIHRAAKLVSKASTVLHGILGRILPKTIGSEPEALVLVGDPNVGKSTMSNHLARQFSSIVSSTKGTTRDLIAKPVDLGGREVQVVDTAGIWQSQGTVGAQSVSNTLKRLLRSSWVVWVHDCCSLRTRAVDGLLCCFLTQSVHTVALNKLDYLNQNMSPAINIISLPEAKSLGVSFVRRWGVNELRRQLTRQASIIRRANEQGSDRKLHPSGKGVIWRSNSDSVPAKDQLESLVTKLGVLQKKTGVLLGVGVPATSLTSLFSRLCVGK